MARRTRTYGRSEIGPGCLDRPDRLAITGVRWCQLPHSCTTSSCMTLAPLRSHMEGRKLWGIATHGEPMVAIHGGLGKLGIISNTTLDDGSIYVGTS